MVAARLWGIGHANVDANASLKHTAVIAGYNGKSLSTLAADFIIKCKHLWDANLSNRSYWPFAKHVSTKKIYRQEVPLILIIFCIIKTSGTILLQRHNGCGAAAGNISLPLFGNRILHLERKFLSSWFHSKERRNLREKMYGLKSICLCPPNTCRISETGAETAGLPAGTASRSPLSGWLLSSQQSAPPDEWRDNFLSSAPFTGRQHQLGFIFPQA